MMKTVNLLNKTKKHLRINGLWLLVIITVAVGAGAAGLGQIFSGHVPVAVSQAVLIDDENFDANDIGIAAKRSHVSVNDDGTAASIGAMVATGDLLVFDIPLINMSDNDATVKATLDIPEPLTDDVDVFWNTLTRYTTPAAQTTTPTPAPVTDTLPQSSDTTFSMDVITGAVEIEPQSSNSSAILDTVQPDMTILPALTGLPDITAQPRNGIEYTVQRPGSATINAQSVNASFHSSHNKLDAAPANQFWGAGPVVVDSAGSVGKYSAMAAKDEDVLYVSYYDASNTRVLFKKSLNGGTTWGNAIELYGGSVHSMAMSAYGNSVFVAYWAGSELRMSYSKNGGQTWGSSQVTPVPTTNYSISVTCVDEKTVFVSFLNTIAVLDWGTLTVARSSDYGASFNAIDMSLVMVGVPNVNGVSGAPTLAAIDEGKIYCSYVNSVDIPVFPPLDIAITVSSLFVATSRHIPSAPFGATAWTPSSPLLVVPTGFSVMNVPVPLAFLGDCTSLYALDENNIFVSYTYKPAYVLPTTLWFARSIPYTDAATFAPGFPVDVPGFCAPFNITIDNSIAAIDTGTVIITYYNDWVGDLMMARSDNYGLPFTWDYYHLDGNGQGPEYTNNDVGRYCSLNAVDGTTLFTMVSYYDSSAGDLRFYAETPGDQNYYTATFREDWDADGELNDLYCLLTDLDDDDVIDRIDLSQDTTFGEADLHDIQTWTSDDERIWRGSRTATTQDDHLGKYWFNVRFEHSLNPDNKAVASITSKSWFENSYFIDLDVDATSDEPAWFVLSDTNSNGLYDTLELSGDDQTYGETIAGLTTLTDTHTGDDDDYNDDERVQKVATEENAYHALYENIRIGRYYTFNTVWDTNPGTDLAPEPTTDTVDTRLTALSRFVGTFDFDVDADGSLTDAGGSNVVYYALSDNNSDGLYDIMNISSPDDNFSHGDLEDDRILSSPENDEWIVAATNDLWTNHATIDPATTTDDMWWGPDNWCWVRVNFDPNPPADLSDTTVLTLNRHVALPGWIIDADGDMAADDEVYFVLSDADSNGDVDVMDVSIGDKVFGEGMVIGRHPPLKDGAVDFFAADNFNDERIDFADFPYLLRLGLHYFSVEADTALLADSEDGHITSRWYVGTFLVDVDNDTEDNIIDFVQVDPDSDGLYTIFELDGDDSDSYDPSEVHDHSDTILDMIGHRVRLFYQQNPAIVHSAILRDGEIINMVPAGEFQWLFTVPASAKPGQEQSQIRIAIEVPPDAPPGYYMVHFVLEQVR